VITHSPDLQEQQELSTSHGSAHTSPLPISCSVHVEVLPAICWGPSCSAAASKMIHLQRGHLDRGKQKVRDPPLL